MKRLLKGFCIIFCTVLALMAATAAGAFFFGRFENNDSGSFSTYEASEGIQYLEMHLKNNLVYIKPSDDGKLRIVYNDSNKEIAFDESGAKLSVYRESGSVVWLGFGSANDTMTVFVPKNMIDIEVVTSNAVIECEDIQTASDIVLVTENAQIIATEMTAGGKIYMQSQNARIDISEIECGENINIVTTNAGIDAEEIFAADELSLNTTNGAIDIENIGSDEGITLVTKNAHIEGSVIGNEEDFAIEAHTTVGKSNLTNREGGKPLTVSTTNAAIEIYFNIGTDD